MLVQGAILGARSRAANLGLFGKGDCVGHRAELLVRFYVTLACRPELENA